MTKIVSGIYSSINWTPLIAISLILAVYGLMLSRVLIADSSYYLEQNTVLSGYNLCLDYTPENPVYPPYIQLFRDQFDYGPTYNRMDNPDTFNGQHYSEAIGYRFGLTVCRYKNGDVVPLRDSEEYSWSKDINAIFKSSETDLVGKLIGAQLYFIALCFETSYSLVCILALYYVLFTLITMIKMAILYIVILVNYILVIVLNNTLSYLLTTFYMRCIQYTIIIPVIITLSFTFSSDPVSSSIVLVTFFMTVQWLSNLGVSALSHHSINNGYTMFTHNKHPFETAMNKIYTWNDLSKFLTGFSIAVVCLLILLGICLYHWLSIFYFHRKFNYKYLRDRVRTRKTALSNYKPCLYHTHASSAKIRAEMGLYQKDLIPRNYKPYHVGAGSDPQDGFDQLYTNKSEKRSPWWSIFVGRDVYIITAISTILNNVWLVFKNSDYYMDVGSFLWLCKPMTVITHDFSKLGECHADFTFSFKDNKVNMQVLGGARYAHNVKRYDSDLIHSRTIINESISSWLLPLLSLLGIELLFTYDVHYFKHFEYNIVHMTPRSITNTSSRFGFELCSQPIRTLKNSYNVDTGTINAQVVVEKVGAKVKRILYVSHPESNKHYYITMPAFKHVAALILNDPEFSKSSVVHCLNNMFKEKYAEEFRDILAKLIPHMDELDRNAYILTNDSIHPRDESVDNFFYMVTDYSDGHAKKVKVEMKADTGKSPDINKPAMVNNPYKHTITRNESRTFKESVAKWLTKFGGDFTNYNCSPGQVMPTEVKKSMQQIFPLLIKQPIFVPLLTKDIDRDAVLGRLLAVNPDTQYFRDNFNENYDVIQQIVDAIVPEPVTPLTIDEMAEYADTVPNLRKRKENFDNDSKGANPMDTAGKGGNNFTKIELQMKAPEEAMNRNITNDSDALVFGMSRFTIPLAAAIGKFIKGYAFKLSSKALGDYIHKLASKYTTVVETDYSSYDGTINSAILIIEYMIYKRAFGDKAQEIIDLKHQGYCASIKGSGYHYSTMGSRHSGAADTSLMNSLVNLVITVYARITFGETDMQLAIDKQVVGGDDGLAFDMSPELAKWYEQKATNFGLTLKAEIKATDAPMNMLSRIYPNARVSPGSGVDMKRMLCKLTHGLKKFSGLEALAMKVAGYLTTDYNTPLVTPFLNELVRVISPMVDFKRIGKFVQSEDIGYSARLGQPYPTDLAEVYINCNNKESVDAIEKATRELKQCKLLTDWKPTHFKPMDVGNYNNTTTTSDKPNKSSVKAQLVNETGLDMSTLSEQSIASIMNTAVTTALRKHYDIYKDKVTNILYMAYSPDVMVEFFRKLDTKFNIFTSNPSKDYEVCSTTIFNKYLVYNPKKNAREYNKDIVSFIKSNSKSNVVFINTTEAFVDKYQKFLKTSNLNYEKIGNSAAVIFTGGVTKSKDPKVPKLNNSPPQPDTILKMKQLPENLKQDLSTAVQKQQNDRHKKVNDRSRLPAGYIKPKATTTTTDPDLKPDISDISTTTTTVGTKSTQKFSAPSIKRKLTSASKNSNASSSNSGGKCKSANAGPQPPSPTQAAANCESKTNQHTDDGTLKPKSTPDVKK